ncbi:MAG: phosphate ABC transporter substrate-binding protein [Candidatus Methanomethylophilaceae archaeon]
MDNKTIGIVLIAVIAVAAVGAGAYFLMDDKDENVTVTVQGSTTVEPIMSKVMESYKNEKGNVTIEMTANGSGTGINALINGTCDMAMSSRDLKSSETAAGMVPITIAKDAVVVAVGAGTGVTDLTLEQVAKIYAGTYTNWNEVGGSDKAIVPLVREESSGTRETIDGKMIPVSGKEEADFKAKLNDYSSKGTTGEMLTAINTTPGSIGYIGMGYVGDLTDGTAVNIGGVTPSEETVLDGTYVISRNLYLVTDGEATGEIKALIDWILGEDGQEIIKSEGFVPLS